MKHLEKYEAADALRGHMAKGLHTIAKINSHAKVHDGIRDNMLVYLDSDPGKKATQAVFLSAKAIIGLALQVRSKVHIDITPPRVPTE